MNWATSNKRSALLEGLLLPEAKKIGRWSEEDETKLYEYSISPKAEAERDMLWRLWYDNKQEFTKKLNEILK